MDLQTKVLKIINRISMAYGGKTSTTGAASIRWAEFEKKAYAELVELAKQTERATWNDIINATGDDQIIKELSHCVLVPVTMAPMFIAITSEEAKELKEKFNNTFGLQANVKVNKRGTQHGSITFIVCALLNGTVQDYRILTAKINKWLAGFGYLGGARNLNIVEIFVSEESAWRCWNHTAITLFKLR